MTETHALEPMRSDERRLFRTQLSDGPQEWSMKLIGAGRWTLSGRELQMLGRFQDVFQHLEIRHDILDMDGHKERGF